MALWVEIGFDGTTWQILCNKVLFFLSYCCRHLKRPNRYYMDALKNILLYKYTRNEEWWFCWWWWINANIIDKLGVLSIYILQANIHRYLQPTIRADEILSLRIFLFQLFCPYYLFIWKTCHCCPGTIFPPWWVQLCFTFCFLSRKDIFCLLACIYLYLKSVTFNSNEKWLLVSLYLVGRWGSYIDASCISLGRDNKENEKCRFLREAVTWEISTKQPLCHSLINDIQISLVNI